MLRDLRVDPSDGIPIWRQIEDGVRRQVTTGAVPAGGAVPSVRDMARALRVNPATVARAYQRLTEAGILTVRRGEGTFVSDPAPGLPAAERRREIDVAAERYVTIVRSVGGVLDDAARGAADAWDRLFAGSGGGA